MRKWVGAGIAYFGLVFLLGMILGPLRILVLEPRIGAVPAVLIELPVMLAASWVSCGWLVGRFGVPAETGARLVMGGLAFLLLTAAELSLSLFAMSGTVSGHLRSYLGGAGLMGLVGQLAFGVFPLLRRSEGLPAATRR